MHCAARCAKGERVSTHEPAFNGALLDNEKQYGLFQVQIARTTGSGWSAAIPPLYATVTNLRLVLKPQTRRPYPPAIIPAQHIISMSEVVLGPYNAVALILSDGYHLYLIAGWRNGHDFSRALRRMINARKYEYQAEFVQPDLDALFRLIEAVKGL